MCWRNYVTKPVILSQHQEGGCAVLRWQSYKVYNTDVKIFREWKLYFSTNVKNQTVRVLNGRSKVWAATYYHARCKNLQIMQQIPVPEGESWDKQPPHRVELHEAINWTWMCRGNNRSTLDSEGKMILAIVIHMEVWSVWLIRVGHDKTKTKTNISIQ